VYRLSYMYSRKVHMELGWRWAIPLWVSGGRCFATGYGRGGWLGGSKGPRLPADTVPLQHHRFCIVGTAVIGRRYPAS